MPDLHSIMQLIDTEKGGRVGIIHRDSLKFQKHSRFHARSFENCRLTLLSGGVMVKVAIVLKYKWLI